MKHLVALALCLLTLTAGAQKVGLVLSGGGAKGFYHIGVIKALEENGIPIDYVSGTSMGSIIAGLYASGYSPDEIKELALSDELKYWVSGKIESRYIYYYKRMNQDRSMLSLNLDLKSLKGFSIIPTSIISSTQVDLSLSRLFAQSSAAAGGDFDKLFVPFRCVASDVYNKKEVIFRSGDAGLATRASMAIPFVYKPVKMDSVLLYDGGLLNNFPWQVMMDDFNPDIVIGSKCVFGMRNPDENNLFEQIEAVTTMRTDFNLPEDKGIMIEHIFDNITALDFSRAPEVIQRGYEDAMKNIDLINSRISRRVDSSDLAKRRAAYRKSLPPLVFDDYSVTGLNSKQEKYTEKALGLQNKGNLFDFTKFKTEYLKFLSEGDIVPGYPSFVYNDSTGYFSANMEMKTKPSLKIMLGGNISSTSMNQAYVGLEYKIIARNAHSARFDGSFSSLHTALSLGLRSDFSLRHPFYYDLSLNYNSYNYLKSNYQSLYSRYGYNQNYETFASLSGGTPLGRSSLFRVNLNLGDEIYRYYNYDQFNPYDVSDKTNFRFYGLQAEFIKHTMNFTMFPTRGIYQSASAIYVNGTENSYPGESNPAYGLNSEANREWIGGRFCREEYFYLLKGLSLGYLLDLTVTNHPHFSTYHATSFTSPAFTPTPFSKSLYIDQFRSRSYLGLGLMPTIEFSDNFYLKNSGYIFVPEEYVELQDNMDSKIRYIISSSLVYQTPVGPASVTLTNFDAGRKNWFIGFNFGYTIFGNKGLFY